MCYYRIGKSDSIGANEQLMIDISGTELIVYIMYPFLMFSIIAQDQEKLRFSDFIWHKTGLKIIESRLFFTSRMRTETNTESRAQASLFFFFFDSFSMSLMRHFAM